MTILKLITAGLALASIAATPASALSGIAAGVVAEQSSGIVRAQFKLPFGMSAKRVRESLTRDGYEEIEITYLGLLDAKADACREGTRYSVKLRANGTYEYRNEIGKCRRQIAATDVDDILRKDGYSDIDVSDDGRVPYAALACRRGERYEVLVDEYGGVTVKGRRGACGGFGDARGRGRQGLSPKDLRIALRKSGYDRITFTDRTPRRFIVEACQGTEKMRLEVNRRGRVRDRQRIGECKARIEASAIPAMLEREGFNRIDIVDDKPPRYRVEACDRQNSRVRIALSPWGDRLNDRKIGECTPPATVASLTEQFRGTDRRFRGARIREGRRYPFIAELCDAGTRREFYFSRWGKLEGEKALGRCVSKRLSEVLDQLRSRGLDSAQVYIEGCRRGNKVRVTLDQYGDTVDRERIGRCNN